MAKRDLSYTKWKGKKPSGEEYQETLSQHELWLSSGGEEGYKADLTGASLVRANLRRANFSEANFRKADFSFADLGFAAIRNANLSYAKVDGADFRYVRMKGARLMGVDMSQTITDPVSAREWARIKKEQGGKAPAKVEQIKSGTAEPKSVTTAEPGRRSQERYYDRLWYLIEHSVVLCRKVYRQMLIACFIVAIGFLAPVLNAHANDPYLAELPLIKIKITYPVFAGLAGGAGFFLYFYFNIYLLRLWELLSFLPRVSATGIPLSQQMDPWFLMSIFRFHFPEPGRKRTFLDKGQRMAAYVLAWFLSPLVLSLGCFKTVNSLGWGMSGIGLGIFTVSALFFMVCMIIKTDVLLQGRDMTRRDTRLVAFWGAVVVVLAAGLLFFSLHVFHSSSEPPRVIPPVPPAVLS